MANIFREENGVMIFELEGKIMGTRHDDSLIDRVYEFIEKGKIKFVFDLSKVEWINSRGLGICITVYTALNNRGGGFKLSCLSEKVRTFLDNCRMFAVFEAYDTVEEAIKSFR